MTGIWPLKEKPDGQLNARGFSEPYVDNTYADVLPPTTMRILLALAASRNLNSSHVDITSAFLRAKIDTPICIQKPHGREKLGNFICKLKKSIYGLRTAPIRWQEKLWNVLDGIGFIPLKFDTNVFRRNGTIVSTCVDDFMIISSNSKIKEAIILSLQVFQVKNLGDMTKFLGINISQQLDT